MHASAPNPRLQFRNLLFATDFSEATGTALAYAAQIARCYGSRLWIAHVVPQHAPPAIPMDPQPLVMDPLWRDAEAQRARFRREHPLPDVPHEFVLEQGALWDVLADIEAKHAIDLIVLGTHGRTGLKRIVMGSVAEEIFRRADCPVLTVGPEVPHKPEAGFKAILFPVDFSEHSLRALPYALSLAEENQASLVLLHCIPLAPADHADDIEHGVIARMKNLVPPSAWPWCKPRFEVRFEIAIEGILAAAKEQQADLIVMGVHSSRHPRAVSHVPWLIASDVACKAHCPVLTIRG